MVKAMLVMALAAACACSATSERPRAVRDPSQSSALGVFMKTHMNPPFSKISFLLFHGEDDAEIDAEALPASANDLARAVERLCKWTELPGESAQSRLVFFEYAESLRSDTLRLVDALRAEQPEGAIKVFDSLRRKCDSCHHFFRYDEPTSREPPSGSAGAR